MRSITLVVAALLVVSCGKDDKKSQYSPLNGEQKTKLGATLESAGRTSRSASIAQEMQKGNFRSVVSTNDSATQMGRRMAGNCKVVFDASGNTGDPLAASSKLKFVLGASGAKCPVELSMNILVENVHTEDVLEVKTEAKGNYLVKDAEFKALNDIYGITFEGGGPFLRVEKNKGEGTSNLTINGKFNSQQYGDLPFDITSRGTVKGGEKGGNGDIATVFTVKYPDYTAELKNVMIFKEGEQPKNEYYLNGETLTQEEYNNWIEKTSLKVSGKQPKNIFSFLKP